MADNLAYTTASQTPPTGTTQRTREVAAGVHLPYVAEIRASGAGPANVATDTNNVTLLASNAARLGATIFNDATTYLYVKFGATASATSFHVKMAPGAYLEVPFGYTGIIDGILSGGTGDARVGEFTY